ncbi:hypothetical protein OSB04_022966 [Centaurea solstitialis]|uniref:Uncharacterized protein n=1 Tax=Centaurea solstitialis TaxID=347529 RepID=A0AA38WAK7_9ASTR|nr:hypothetical protein OSB04_022966 [Centaurea solstitialis]
MLTAQSPVTGDHLLRPNTGRRPLQPIKSPSNLPPIDHSHQKKPNLKLGWIDDSSNKENPNPNPNQNEKRDLNRSSICTVAADPVQIEQFEVSLADELNAMREKMERLRLDREKTEKMLREREVMMEMKMKDLDHRGQIQKVLEMEVDRLYRLNELRSLCNPSQRLWLGSRFNVDWAGTLVDYWAPCGCPIPPGGVRATTCVCEDIADQIIERERTREDQTR